MRIYVRGRVYACAHVRVYVQVRAHPHISGPACVVRVCACPRASAHACVVCTCAHMCASLPAVRLCRPLAVRLSSQRPPASRRHCCASHVINDAIDRRHDAQRSHGDASLPAGSRRLNVSPCRYAQAPTTARN